MIAAVVIVNLFVIPTFAKTFSRAGIELPWITRALLSVSHFFTTYSTYLLCVLAGLFVLTIYYFRRPEGKLWMHKMLLKLPIVGKVIKHIILLRFSQTFSIIIKSGIPIIDGLKLVADAMQNAYASQEILALSDEVERGKSLTQAAVGNSLLTPLEIQLFAVSEQTGELAMMLGQIAEFYRREIDYDLKRLTDFIEPALIFALSGLILLLAFAVYLPIWNMVNMVHT